jgi:hypothetical protein
VVLHIHVRPPAAPSDRSKSLPKPNEAKAQFARAAQLDLTPSEKAELAKMSNA